MNINPDTFHTKLTRLVAGRKVCVAYSGGVDSHVLLHLLASQPHLGTPAVRAVYIHHGLQAEADQWAQHCAEIAHQLSIPFQIIHVRVDQTAEIGMEAAAREARYRAFSRNLDDDEVLLTAQHQHDQAETLLLQLLRGAGPAGLAAMSSVSTLFSMTVIRPLLDVSKDCIVNYAEQHQLNWVEDPSNRDSRIYRNYIRHKVWPVLERRWSGVDITLSRSARHCQDSVRLMNDMASIDAQSVCAQQWHQLDLQQLGNLPEYRQRNVLRYAIEQSGFRLPSTAVLDNLLTSILQAEEDSSPLVEWDDVQARRFKQTLFLLKRETRKWQPVQPLTLTTTAKLTLDEKRILSWQQMLGQGLKLSVIDAGLEVRYRLGGERIQLHRQKQHKKLKHLLQEWQIPPWQRNQIPLLYANDELVAVVGYGCAETYVVSDEEVGWLPVLLIP